MTVRLENGRYRLDIDPAFGCRWRQLEARAADAWVPLFWEGRPSKRKDALFGGAYLMGPWCNRIPRATFRFGGRVHRLRPNFPDGSAIHGDVWGRPWNVKRRTRTLFEATLDTRDHPDFNFPFPLRFRHRVSLAGAAVRATLSVENVGRSPAPAGLGFHPFFLKSGPDSLSLTIPAEKVYPSRNAVPSGPARPVASARFGSELDHGFTSLTRTPVQLASGRLAISLGYNAACDDLYVWAPRRFRGKPAPFLCVEPMTMSVDGIRRGKIKILRPRKTLALSWDIQSALINQFI